MLDENEACKVIQKDDSASFQFGDGAKVVSKKKVLFPAVIGKKEITIEANVVRNDIPLLLSRDSMKRADTVMCFGSDKARICVKKSIYFRLRVDTIAYRCCRELIVKCQQNQ